MSTVSAQAIEESLKQCMDPEVPLNIVEMGLIYGIDVAENNDVNVINPAFDMTPPELISGIITEKGVATAPYEESIPKLFEANN